MYDRADVLSREAIGAAISVQRSFGPGLLESIYHRCLAHELDLRGIRSATQRTVRIVYRGLEFDEVLRCDLLVEDCLLLELKAVEHVLGIHKAQLLTYMRLLDVPIGLLMNFHERPLAAGIQRLVLPGADRAEPCEVGDVDLQGHRKP